MVNPVEIPILNCGTIEKMRKCDTCGVHINHIYQFINFENGIQLEKEKCKKCDCEEISVSVFQKYERRIKKVPVPLDDKRFEMETGDYIEMYFPPTNEVILEIVNICRTNKDVFSAVLGSIQSPDKSIKIENSNAVQKLLFALIRMNDDQVDEFRKGVIDMLGDKEYICWLNEIKDCPITFL